MFEVVLWLNLWISCHFAAAAMGNQINHSKFFNAQLYYAISKLWPYKVWLVVLNKSANFDTK